MQSDGCQSHTVPHSNSLQSPIHPGNQLKTLASSQLPLSPATDCFIRHCSAALKAWKQRAASNLLTAVEIEEERIHVFGFKVSGESSILCL